MTPNVFLSVGTPFLEEQEDFVKAVEQYLRENGLVPRALNRTDYWNTGRPLEDVTKLMKQCSGTVIVAFERKCIRDGVEKRGGELPKQVEGPIKDEKIPTVWNHIEAAQAYMLGHSLLVIAEEDLPCEGLIDDRYDWYVHWVRLTPSILNDPQFRGVFADWKQRVEQHHEAAREPASQPSTKLDPGELSTIDTESA